LFVKFWRHEAGPKVGPAFSPKLLKKGQRPPETTCFPYLKSTAGCDLSTVQHIYTIVDYCHGVCSGRAHLPSLFVAPEWIHKTVGPCSTFPKSEMFRLTMLFYCHRIKPHQIDRYIIEGSEWPKSIINHEPMEANTSFVIANQD